MLPTRVAAAQKVPGSETGGHASMSKRDPVSAAIDLQRAVGNRAMAAILARQPQRALARKLTHRGKAIPKGQVPLIEQRLRAESGVTFPWMAWEMATGKGTEPKDLGAWLNAYGYPHLDAGALIADARRQRRAAAPPKPTMGALDPLPHLTATHYAAPVRLIDPDLINEESLFDEDWPELPTPILDLARPRWDPERFLAAFARHVNAMREQYMTALSTAGGERDLELERTTTAERRLMDISWVLDKLNPKRTCVAVTWTGFSVRLYANEIDQGLVTDAELIQAVMDEIRGKGPITPTPTDFPVLHGLMERVLKSTGPRKESGEVESAPKFGARADKAFRRIVKASEELAALRGRTLSGQLQIVAHTSHQGGKHAEMRLLDAITSFTEGSVSISKICCAKCFAAINAASAIRHADLRVQGAHFATYESESGWPVPHFLKQKPDAMKAFLGDEAFAWFMAYPTEAIAAIERRALKVPRTNRTDPYSSGEDEPRKKRSPKRQPKSKKPSSSSGF